MTCSLDDLKHAAFGATFAITAHNAHLDPVLVQHGTHLVGGQIDVGLTVITGHKPMSITVTQHGSFNFVQQAAGLANIFDTIILFPEMPGWRNW